MSSAIVGNEIKSTWRLLWGRTLGKVIVAGFALLISVYLFELGPDAFRSRMSAHLDRLILPLTVVLLLVRTRRVDRLEERRFWRLLLIGLSLWLVGSLLYWAAAISGFFSWHNLAVDIFYMAFYLFMFLAADQQPQLSSGWSKRDILYPFTMTAAGLFIAILFGYFIVVPWAVLPSENDQYFSSFNLYVTLDSFLTVRFILLWRAATSVRWRRCFALLAMTTSLLAVCDLLEGMGFAGLIDAVVGGRIDFIYLMPNFCLLVMVLTCTAGKTDVDDDTEESNRRVPSLLPFYAFMLPLVHIGMYLFGYLDPAARAPREAIVFSGLVVFAILSLVQQISLERAVVSLRKDLVVRALDDKLRQSQRMESIGRLAGGVAHDLNNLLMVIKSYVGLAERKVPEADGGTRSKLREIDRAADRSADLIRQLLAFGKKQVLKPEIVAVNDQIRSLEGMLSRILGDDVDLVVDLDPSAGFIRVDRGLLEQVVVNLAVNARDAMPRGGRLVISSRPVPGDGAATVESGQTLDFVEIDVTDTGAGMESSIQERIFEPYFTTKGMEKGTGLGLATVYGIVEQSGGTIEVESEVGRGSTFRVRLPQTSDRPVVEPLPPATGLRSVSGETVLLTEDEETIRKALTEFLDGLGLVVLQAVDGVDAMEVASRHTGTIDILVTDLVMPRMNGPDLAEHLRAHRPGIRVIYVSGFTPDAMQEYGVTSQDAVFLQKPFLLEELASTIQEVLDSR